MRRLVWGMFLSVVFIAACSSGDEATPCEFYCDSMTDCYETMNQPFSRSACLRDCSDSVERHSSVGCRNRYHDLLACKSDLSCSNANAVSDECSREIDDLARCVEQ